MQVILKLLDASYSNRNDAGRRDAWHWSLDDGKTWHPEKDGYKVAMLKNLVDAPSVCFQHLATIARLSSSPEREELQRLRDLLRAECEQNEQQARCLQNLRAQLYIVESRAEAAETTLESVREALKQPEDQEPLATA